MQEQGRLVEQEHRAPFLWAKHTERVGRAAGEARGRQRLDARLTPRVRLKVAMA